MSILKNAIDSISIGMEDYKSPDHRRMISCTRNLYAGILLLFKHKLAVMSPPGSDEVLIKEKILPVNSSTGLQWKGKGRKTVDVNDIKERFTSLEISVDWKRIEKIQGYRNEIEHHYSSTPQKSVQTIISDSFLVIRDFIRIHLAQDPLILLGKDTWENMTNIAEVYQAEKDECIESILKIDWKYDSIREAFLKVACDDCGSDLIEEKSAGPNRESSEFRCRSCNKRYDFENMAELSMDQYFSGENFANFKNGGDPVTIDCPSCFRKNTYNLEINECVVCDDSYPTECMGCGGEILPSEMGNIDHPDLCSWCSQVRLKDDD